MPVWLIILIIAAIIGAIWGFSSSNDGERGAGAASGALAGATGCGYLLLHLFLWGCGLFLLIWLFSAIF